MVLVAGGIAWYGGLVLLLFRACVCVRGRGRRDECAGLFGCKVVAGSGSGSVVLGGGGKAARR